ncbi:SMI1/KNR4 family protein [Pseudomonas sp. KNUC1026]|uniref:SMI1/KNR4 family protein n=1 Tax=Pseudomonas sp. KNUC1026 TaxID=2893890 RepID=UPI001F2ECE68|nr:SMI1/KNR4 family protein [Pseudomonas sp. KNUC1026]UFH51371.1 SMI1/KNR4 family protein [Pseudomonas sp. KNUC1026]
MLVLKESEAEISLGDFQEIEKIVKGNLPSIFKRLYIKNNGGFPEVTRLEVDDFIYSINGFHSVRYGRLPIDKLILDFYQAWPELKGFVPFAYDDGGNEFMLCLNEDGYENVFLWLADERRLEKVCCSFEAFCQR